MAQERSQDSLGRSADIAYALRVSIVEVEPPLTALPCQCGDRVMDADGRASPHDHRSEALRWLVPALEAHRDRGAWLVDTEQPHNVLHANSVAAGRPPGPVVCRRMQLPGGLTLVLGPPTADVERLPYLSSRWRLTDRQRCVLVEVLRGSANKEIAVVMNVSVSMVEQHLRAIFRKAGVDQRGALISRFWSTPLPLGVAEQAG